MPCHVMQLLCHAMSCHIFIVFSLFFTVFMILIFLSVLECRGFPLHCPAKPQALNRGRLPGKIWQLARCKAICPAYQIACQNAI